jgi:hypothetical protein
MSNFDTFLNNNRTINKNILKDIPNIKKYINIDQTCKCEMGHNDIRATIYGCERCKILYNVSSFKDKCDNYAFEVMYGYLREKKLIIKIFNNCNIIINESLDQHNKSLDNIERNIKSFYELSDKFTNIFITNLIINKVFINLVPKIYCGFKCCTKCFILEEYINDQIDKDNVIKCIVKLFNSLKKLRELDYNHNNLIYKNVMLSNNNNIKLINLEYSSITYKNNRYNLSDFFNRYDNFNISLEKNKKYYIINSGGNHFLKSLIYNGLCFYPCVFDFYCFIVSLLLDKNFYEILMDNEYFMEKIYKIMFFPGDYLKLDNSFPSYTNNEITIEDCIYVLENIKIRYNIFDLIK